MRRLLESRPPGYGAPQRIGTAYAVILSSAVRRVSCSTCACATRIRSVFVMWREAGKGHGVFDGNRQRPVTDGGQTVGDVLRRGQRQRQLPEPVLDHDFPRSADSPPSRDQAKSPTRRSA